MTAAPARDRGRRAAIVLVAVLLLGAVVRGIFLAQLERSELGNVLSLDSRFYRDLAATIVAGGAPPPGALTFNPLYPAFLVLMFRLFGDGLLAPRLVQFALGLLTVALLYLAGRRLAADAPSKRSSREATGLVAAVCAVLYPQLVLYEGMLLATSLEVFLLTASFAVALAIDQDAHGDRPLALRGRRVPPWASSLILGALCGAGALGRPNLFFLLLVSLPIWLIARSRGARGAWLCALTFVAGASLFLAPPIVYNAKSTGRFVPVTAHGGINFFIGNRAGASGLFNPPDDMRADMRGLVEDARAKAEASLGRPATDAEVSNYFFDRALGDIKAHPADWLRLLGKKFMLFFNKAEVPDVPNVFFCEDSCRVLAILFVPFAAIAPLGLAGLVVLCRGGRNRSVVAIFLGCACASVLLFYVNVRYRLPAVPLLILCAALFIVWAAGEISRGRWREVALLAAIAAALFFLVSARTIARVNRSAAYTFLGNHYIDAGDEARAAEAFAEAYRLDPNHIETMINYARVLQRRHDSSEAAELYGRAYALMPRFPRLAIEYGSALESLGQRDRAKELYREAYSSDRARDRVLACQLLARAAITEGRKDEAIVWVRRALEIVPGDPKLSSMLDWLERGR